MSHRLSCLSMDFGLHLIRAITSFISSVFASRFNNSAGNRDSQDSFCKDSSCSQSSSSSMRSTSFGLLSSFSPSYTIVAYDNNGRSSQSTAPTIILTTPSGHRHRYDVRNKQRRSRHQSYLCPFDNDRDDCQIDHHNKLSSRISNFNLSSNSDSALSTPEDEDQITIRQQTMAKKVKVTEKELRHLNHKIEKLLVKLEEEYETEMATSPDEECVICISAKATMQTFPCGHRVVCRKCFVKTIQMVVSQRMLPLRCVICRAKVLRLTTGSGFPSNGNSSGGYMRTNKRKSTPDIYSIDTCLVANKPSNCTVLNSLSS